MGSNVKGRSEWRYICLEELRKPVETYAKMALIRTKDLPQNLLNTKENC